MVGSRKNEINKKENDFLNILALKLCDLTLYIDSYPQDVSFIQLGLIFKKNSVC